MDRITKNTLESLVTKLNTLQNRPIEAWTNDHGVWRSNVNCLILDHNPNNNLYNLEIMANTAGGTYVQYGRVSLREMYSYLRGLIDSHYGIRDHNKM